MIETLHFEGIIRVRRIPEEWSASDYAYWWLPKRGRHGRLIRPARMSEREKERYTEAAFSNMLMVAGRTQILTYIGSSTGNSTAFGKYLAVGTGALSAPSPTDALLVTEVVRKALAGFTVQGTQVDLNFAFASGDANAVLTEAGIFGDGASATINTGTLMTHALFSYTKGAYSVSLDYLANLF